MAELPGFFLPRPPLADDPAAIDGFERLYEAVRTANGARVEYDLPTPRWQFLAHLADNKPILFHGSNDTTICEFEPRKANDRSEFADQCASRIDWR